LLDVEKELGNAVKHFWLTRSAQAGRQGRASGQKDAGSRADVTGGKHADGFVQLISRIVSNAGLEDALIHRALRKHKCLPGYFRPTKEWDLVVLSGKNLVAVVEVKSQVGSFGNNFNNRVEEALGSATDFWAAYRTGIYKPTQKPWLGYLFMLEESPGSLRKRRPIRLSPFAVDERFQNKSYAQNYTEVCRRLVRERLYDAACFFTSSRDSGKLGKFNQPSQELSIKNFAVSLHARASAFAKLA
jgi:hypothetical protein